MVQVKPITHFKDLFKDDDNRKLMKMKQKDISETESTCVGCQLIEWMRREVKNGKVMISLSTTIK